jgi:hypothetical protein
MHSRRVVSLVARISTKSAKWAGTPTWFRTKRAIDSGQAPGDKPIVAFTILGVGNNNPGIYVIAAGAIMMNRHPWAFYVKPMLLRAKSGRFSVNLRRKVARGESMKPGAGGSTGPERWLVAV